MIDEAEIGKRIRKFRLKKNLTLQMLAGRTGYSKGYLSKVEKSDKAPPVATLSTIARQYGTDNETLIAFNRIEDGNLKGDPTEVAMVQAAIDAGLDPGSLGQAMPRLLLRSSDDSDGLLAC